MKTNNILTILLIFSSISSCKRTEFIGKLCNQYNLCGEINTKELYIKDAGGNKFKLEKIDEKSYKVIGKGTIHIISDKKLKWPEYGGDLEFK